MVSCGTLGVVVSFVGFVDRFALGRHTYPVVSPSDRREGLDGIPREDVESLGHYNPGIFSKICRVQYELVCESGSGECFCRHGPKRKYAGINENDYTH